MPHCCECDATQQLQYLKGRHYCPAHVPPEFRPPTLLRVKKDKIKCWKCGFDTDKDVCPECGQDLRQYIEGG